MFPNTNQKTSKTALLFDLEYLISGQNTFKEEALVVQSVDLFSPS